MRGASPRPPDRTLVTERSVADTIRHVVTAVVVAHDAARLLPGLVNAVREQTHPVQRVVGVDTGSQDRSGAALTELLGQDAVFGMEADTGYGAAVARALQHPAARRAPRSPGDPAAGTEWIWLLHDDCEPAPDALEQLLAAASRSRSAAVLGPKLMDLSDRRVVREAGITTDRAGRRLTGVEPGEIDQGQHDGNRAVLAVSSAGMLVRRDVWDQLGGFDANLPLFRDDIDFCWRAHAAGYEVRVVTDAVVYHRELSARQIRRTPATGGHPRMLDRRSALYVFAVNLPLWPMLAIADRLRRRVAGPRGLLPAHQAAAQGRGPPRRGGLAAAAPAAAAARAPPPGRRPQARLRGAARASCRAPGRWAGSPSRRWACCPAARATTAAGCTTPWWTSRKTTCRCPPPIRSPGACSPARASCCSPAWPWSRWSRSGR